ncbi:hypothetical protein DQ04_06461030 [Trypanosoma grayi]|uniref:hypothetical protein n=1 Tax=Trypanosoma grayi TaxID=71804 RepID=UPI0004F430F2|nr:hypothetical protein DQ04_06461030 [Trypanosoma grayi]KEG08783.1 hypothetical protein DQ04_06461030 [Trypanosoma grayi]
MVTWQSKDPLTDELVPYTKELSELLEVAFQRGEPSYTFSLGANRFTVVFSKMVQRNRRGGERRVRRLVGSTPCCLNRVPVVNDDTLTSVLRNCARLDTQLRALEKSLLTEVSMDGVDTRPFLDVYNVLLGVMQDRFLVNKYGGSAEDVRLCLRGAMEPVPNYYANITHGSVYRRIVLSILGLRNLVFAGVPIFATLQKKKFSSGADEYKESEGLPLMRSLTGNTVDLDTVVMNVPVYLKSLSAMLSKDGQPIFPTTESFLQSNLCRETVFTVARCLISSFVEDLQLAESEMAYRQLILNESEPIHVAKRNSDRGRHPVWHYLNAHVSTFHVNVPNIPDIVGALLKSPFYLPKAIALSIQNRGNTEDVWLDIVENAISDSCFNGKWKAVEQFLATAEEYNSIPTVLFRLQRDARDIFTPVFLYKDAAREKERAVMKRLVFERQLCGFDPQTKTTRLIRDEDIEEWVRATN